jgi:hypothetical protein
MQLNKKASEYDRIAEVKVFADTASRAGKNQVLKGVLEDGMSVVVFYDEESCYEYFLGEPTEYPK